MKIPTIRTFALITYILTLATTSAAQAPAPTSPLTFNSNDPELQATFDWAKNMALTYSHGPGDPVGPWCEAALPQREAFCIRDVCHQSIGAHLLGLTGQNMNMMEKFVDNIALSRDWCSYWEVDRHDRPAPIDYRSDKEFWYNLNANFDIIHTTWRLYNWTADRRYISADNFTDFYNLSLTKYMDSWQLQPENIMTRPRYMNRADDITPNNQFDHCRGIPSYVENFPGICVGLDLMASLYAGHMAAANISRLNGRMPDCDSLRDKAHIYRQMIDNGWWDTKNSRYNPFYTENGEFAYGEGIPFALWFGIIGDTQRRSDCVDTILSHDWNIENLSYFPAILLDLGYPEQAYNLIVGMPAKNRSEYPEVSFGIIEAIIRCAMGITPDATVLSLTTEYRLLPDDKQLEARNIPLFGGTIDLAHNGPESTTIVNNTGVDIKWTPLFRGKPGRTVTVKPGKKASAKNVK